VYNIDYTKSTIPRLTTSFMSSILFSHSREAKAYVLSLVREKKNSLLNQIERRYKKNHHHGIGAYLLIILRLYTINNSIIGMDLLENQYLLHRHSFTHEDDTYQTHLN